MPNLRYRDINMGDVTIGSAGYTDITANRPSDITIVGASIRNWAKTTPAGVFNVTCLGNYALGAPGMVITGLVVRYYY